MYFLNLLVRSHIEYGIFIWYYVYTLLDRVYTLEVFYIAVIELIDLFEDESMISFFKDNYGFDLKKDLKNTQLSKKHYNRMLKDLMMDLQALPINGDKVTASSNGEAVIYKIRYKDEQRHLGSSGGYRVICLIVTNNKAYPFHIYHKRSGKKPKSDLSEKEKLALNKMVEDVLK